MFKRHFSFPRAAALLLTLLCCLGAVPARAAEPMDLLLIGVDGYGQENAGRSDAMLLVRADPEAGEVRMVSFLRDLYVSIPGCGKTRLNAAWYFGGEELLKKTLSNAFGVQADYTVTVNFSMLEELIDQLGGVEVEISESELPRLNDVLMAYNQRLGLGPSHGLLKSAGLQTLSGKQALSYSRIRKADSDFQRVGRQQTVLSAMLQKIRSLDFFSLTRLAVANLGKVRTDLGLGELSRLLPLATGGQTQLHTARVPFDGAFTEMTVDGMQVLAPDLAKNRTRLAAFLEGA